MKLTNPTKQGVGYSRSRKGAWIEMPQANLSAFAVGSRSRKGAWIEIIVASEGYKAGTVAPARERGLKSAFWYQ